MGSRWLARAVATTAAVGIFTLASSAAWANSTIDINPGNLGTTADGFKSHECNAKFGGGPLAGQDVWVFNLPGNHDLTGDFVTVTATFDTGSGTATKIIPTDGGAVVLDSGTSKAWIALPAGWKLTAATAVITGVADNGPTPKPGDTFFFVLTHTCPASVDEESPSPEASPSEDVQESPTPGESPSEGTVPSPSASTPGLPVTGTAVAGIVTTGVLLIGVGAGLVLMHRRRALTDAAQ